MKRLLSLRRFALYAVAGLLGLLLPNLTTYPSAGTVASAAVVPDASAICRGTAPTADQYTHIIWIWMENQSYNDIVGNDSDAPYENTLAQQCGMSKNFLDNSLSALPSGPNYLAYSSGGNCNGNALSNVNPTKGCITKDLANNDTTITARSIFSQIDQTDGALTWKSYNEGMPSNCDGSNSGGTGSGSYAVRHNPAPFFSGLSSCATKDIGFPVATCSASHANKACTLPSGTNRLLNDINNATLPNFATITPAIGNDMHLPGTVTQGDNWLATYLPLIFDGPNYQAGDTAVFVLWDESSDPSDPMANFVIAPTVVAGTKSAVTTDQIGVLWNTQKLLGLNHTLGCTAGGSSCPSGSTNDFTASFNLR